MSWNSITAIFGGTFDPPHLGHREAVQGLFREPGVKRVLIIPSARPPHKPEHATALQRWEMAQLTFDGIPDVTLDDRELKRTTPSYSFDTLNELRRDHGENLAFVIGTDQLALLSSWYRFPEVLELCHWLVLERKGGNQPNAFQKLQASGALKPQSDRTFITRGGRRLELHKTEAQALSSTEIRKAIALTGQPPQDSLRPSVSRYLNTHRIYGSSAP